MILAVVICLTENLSGALSHPHPDTLPLNGKEAFFFETVPISPRFHFVEQLNVKMEEDGRAHLA